MIFSKYGLGHVRELLENFESISTALNVVLIRKNKHDATLRQNVKVAVIATSLNNSSLDYVKKRYLVDSVDDINVKPSHDIKEAYVDIYYSCKNYINEVRNRLQPNKSDLPEDSIFGASLVLERLEASFFAAHLLYSLGHSYEAHAVSRLILEQIAWSVAAYTLQQTTEVDEIITTKSIIELKKIIPEAGNLYGFLSKKTHIDFNSHSDFFKVQDGVNQVRYAHADFEEYGTVLIYLADFFCIAWEFTQRDYLSEFESIRINLGNVSLIEDRPFLLKMKNKISKIVL